MYIFGLDEGIFFKNIRILIIKLIVLKTLSLIALSIKVNPNSKSRKSDKFNRFALNSLSPSKFFIHGFNSEFEIKI
jgi:hypothetical protein